MDEKVQRTLLPCAVRYSAPPTMRTACSASVYITTVRPPAKQTECHARSQNASACAENPHSGPSSPRVSVERLVSRSCFPQWLCSPFAVPTLGRSSPVLVIWSGTRKTHRRSGEQQTTSCIAQQTVRLKTLRCMHGVTMTTRVPGFPVRSIFPIYPLFVQLKSDTRTKNT